MINYGKPEHPSVPTAKDWTKIDQELLDNLYQQAELNTGPEEEYKAICDRINEMIDRKYDLEPESTER